MNKIYDYSGALRRMGNDPELFQEMASLLRSDAPPLLMVVQTSFNAGDAARWAREKLHGEVFGKLRTLGED